LSGVPNGLKCNPVQSLSRTSQRHECWGPKCSFIEREIHNRSQKQTKVINTR